MEYGDLYKLLNLGFAADLEQRTLTLRAGPLTLERIPIPTFRALSKDTHHTELILSETFINRGIMWIDFRREKVDACIGSLEDLKAKCLLRATEFGKSGKPTDSLFATLFSAWANECASASRTLRSALDDERDPINTGMDVSAADAIPDALGTLRRNTYPFVGLMVSFLPDGNAVRAQARDRLHTGTDLLVQHYGVSTGDIANATWEISPRAA